MTVVQKQPVVVPRDTILPPPRPGVRHVHVPMLGIVISDDTLRRRVNRRFHWPMIILALLVLPLLAVELFWPPLRWSAMWWLSAIGMAIIWTAFVIEFAIKITIAESRVEYVRRNWLDVIIIALPALRPLRVAAVARTTRVFTLRGVGMKFARYVFTAVVGLEATERVLHRIGVKAKKGRLDPKSMTRHQLMQEVRRLRRLTDAWEQWHVAWEKHALKHGDDVDDLPDPPAAIDDLSVDPSDTHVAEALPLQSPDHADRPRPAQSDHR